MQPYVQDDALDFVQLFLVLWEKRKIILWTTGATFLAAILYLHVATYKYTATLVVTPVDRGSSGISNKLGGLAGLASVAGINLPQDQGVSYFQLYTEGYKTRHIAQALTADPLIMRQVFSAEWSPQAQKFVPPASAIKPLIVATKHFLGVPVYAWRKPDAARLQEYIGRNVKVAQDKKTSLVTISFNHPDPAFAAYFLKNLHGVVDNQLRLRAKKRAEESIAYLSQQLLTVTLAEHREAIAQSLSEQEKIRMMANSKMAFSADPLEDPVVSSRPTSPKALVVLGISLIIGFGAGVLFIFLHRHLMARRSYELVVD